ncbi:MAG TPA: hypothetical protein VN673_14025 [Clostridia bacterium]|nr:hypothetical protein [Clostridia bacterium]
MQDQRKKVSTLSFGDVAEVRPDVSEIIAREVVNTFLKELFNETDRSAVIIAASYFEQVLLKRILLRLEAGNDQARKNLTAMNGALSTFSARIDLAFCLAELDQLAWEDMHSLRRIRNFCAHNWEGFRLNGKVETLHLAKLHRYLNLHGVPLVEYAPRTQFNLFAASYALSLNYGIKPS